MSVTKSTFFPDTIPSIEMIEQSNQEQESVTKANYLNYYEHELDDDGRSLKFCEKCRIELMKKCECKQPVKLTF